MGDEIRWTFWKNNSPQYKLVPTASFVPDPDEVNILCRELIQNSIDAAADPKTVPVVVEARIGEVKKDTVDQSLHLSELIDHIQGTKELAQSSQSNIREQKVVSVCNNQLTVLAQPTIKYFKFSDFNTTGIDGCNSVWSRSKNFWKLVFEQGSSGKNDANSAGGVGVGKDAAFPFTTLSTVFYSTKTNCGYGLAGTCRMSTSKIGDSVYYGEGNLIHSTPIEGEIGNYDNSRLYALKYEEAIAISEEMFARKENGTDVILFGVDNIDVFKTDEWFYRFALSSIKNFFVAILNKRLVVKLFEGNESIVIDDQTIHVVLDELVKGDERFQDEARETAELLDAYLCIPGDPDILQEPIEGNIEGIGRVSLYCNKRKTVDTKSILTIRSQGMATINFDYRNTDSNYCGEVIIHDKEGGNLLLSAEAANHQAYDFKDLPMEKANQVRQAIANLEKWIKEQVREFTRIDSSTTDTQLRGLEKYICLEDVVESKVTTLTKPKISLLPAEKPKPQKSTVGVLTKGTYAEGGDDEDSQLFGKRHPGPI